MIPKLITNIILIISLALVQVAFISGLTGWLNNLNLLLVVLLFILGFANLDLALAWALGLGLALELFSFLPFGAYLASLALTVVAANFLLDYFFTNRSLYSFLALTGLATAIYELIIYAMVFILAEISPGEFSPSGDFLAASFKQIGLNLLGTLLIFYIIHFLLRNFKPVFLVKNKS